MRETNKIAQCLAFESYIPSNPEYFLVFEINSVHYNRYYMKKSVRIKSEGLDGHSISPRIKSVYFYPFSIKTGVQKPKCSNETEKILEYSNGVQFWNLRKLEIVREIDVREY